MIRRLKIIKPDDWHLHLRDGAMLQAVVPISARHFARAIVMPNLIPPVTNVEAADSYRNRILSALPEGADFEPFMTLYLTENTEPGEMEKAARCGFVLAVKLYPAGATTNSDSGVRDFGRIFPTLEKMAELAIPLCVHGEAVDSRVDIFDREAVFIERILDPIRRRIPDLKIVFEHITTSDGVEYVREGGNNMAATITVHHLVINRNHVLAGGIRPHYYCLPIAKRESHRLALIRAATSGDKCFFLGTDSAPHPENAKLSSCGCAGIFSALNAMSCLAHIFEEANSLDNLEAFTSRNGAIFYCLPENRQTLTLTKNDEPVSLPPEINTLDGPVTVFDPGFTQYWSAE